MTFCNIPSRHDFDMSLLDSIRAVVHRGAEELKVALKEQVGAVSTGK